MPGEQWAPAWVEWRHGNGYVGWTPLPPEARWQGGRIHYTERVDFYAPAFRPAWVFVAETSFLSPALHSHCEPPARNITFFNRTTNVTNYTVVNQTIINRSINVQRIEAATRGPVPVVNVTQVDKPHGGRDGHGRDGRQAGTETTAGSVPVFRPVVTGRDGKPALAAGVTAAGIVQASAATDRGVRPAGGRDANRDGAQSTTTTGQQTVTSAAPGPATAPATRDTPAAGGRGTVRDATKDGAKQVTGTEPAGKNEPMARPDGVRAAGSNGQSSAGTAPSPAAKPAGAPSVPSASPAAAATTTGVSPSAPLATRTGVAEAGAPPAVRPATVRVARADDGPGSAAGSGPATGSAAATTPPSGRTQARVIKPAEPAAVRSPSETRLKAVQERQRTDRQALQRRHEQERQRASLLKKPAVYRDQFREKAEQRRIEQQQRAVVRNRPTPPNVPRAQAQRPLKRPDGRQAQGQSGPQPR